MIYPDPDQKQISYFSILLNPIHESVQGRFRPFGGNACGRSFDNDVDITAAFYPVPVVSKILADDSFQAVSDDGVPDLFGNRYPETDTVKPVGSVCQDEVTVGNAFPRVR